MLVLIFSKVKLYWDAFTYEDKIFNLILSHVIVDSFDRNTIGFTIDLSHFGLSLNIYNIFIKKIKK